MQNSNPPGVEGEFPKRKAPGSTPALADQITLEMRDSLNRERALPSDDWPLPVKSVRRFGALDDRPFVSGPVDGGAIAAFVIPAPGKGWVEVEMSCEGKAAPLDEKSWRTLVKAWAPSSGASDKANELQRLSGEIDEILRAQAEDAERARAERGNEYRDERARLRASATSLDRIKSGIGTLIVILLIILALWWTNYWAERDAQRSMDECAADASFCR